jgi:hypothetical protein
VEVVAVSASVEQCRFCDCVLPSPDTLIGPHTVACPRYAEFGQTATKAAPATHSKKTKVTSSTHSFSWLEVRGQKAPSIKVEALNSKASNMEKPAQSSMFQSLNVISATPCLPRWKWNSPLVICLQARVVLRAQCVCVRFSLSVVLCCADAYACVCAHVRCLPNTGKWKDV